MVVRSELLSYPPNRRCVGPCDSVPALAPGVVSLSCPRNKARSDGPQLGGATLVGAEYTCRRGCFILRLRAAADSSPSPPPPVIVVIDFVEPAAFRLRAPRVINQSMVRGAAAGPPQICVVWPSPPPREVSLAAAGCLTSCISTSPDGGAFQPLGWRCVDVSLCGCCWIYT